MTTWGVFRLLAIGDDAERLAELKAMVEGTLLGARWRCAASGSSGLAAALIEEPDVILLDGDALGDGAHRLCCQIKADARLGGVPVVWMSARGSDQASRSAALEAGAEGLLAFPLDQAELTAQLRAMAKIKAADTWRSERDQAQGALRSTQATLEALRSVVSLADADFKTICDHVLATLVRMTGSEYGFYGFVSADQATMTIHAWSGEAMLDCAMVDKPQCFAISQAGVWGEAVRRRKPLILNDYAAAHPAKKGLPVGHVPLTKLLVAPFFAHGQITALAAVANRAQDYDQDDVAQITAFLASIRALTERLEAEEALRLSEQRLAESNQLLSGVLGHTHMMAVYLNPQFDFIWVNRAYADTCRREPPFFTGKNHFELYPHAENQAIFQRVVDTGEPFFVAAKPFEFPDQPERGVTYWDWSLVPIKGAAAEVIGLVFTLADVTQRIRAEAALRESEERFRQIVERSNEVFYRQDLRSARFDYVSPKVTEVLGYTPAEFLRQSLDEQMAGIHPDDVPLLRSFVADLVEADAQGKGFIEREFRLKDKHGSYCWVHGNYTLIRDSAGRPHQVVGSLSDITARKRAEQTLRGAEESLRSMLNAICESALLLTPEGIVLEANATVAQRFGRRPEDLLGQDMYALLPPDVAANRRAMVAGALRSGQLTQFEDRRLGRDILNSIYPVLDADGQVSRLAVVGFDVTERKKAEEALRALAESSVGSGVDLFRFVVRQLALSLGVRYALLARVDPSDPNMAHTVAVWSGDGYADNFGYALDGTPCHNVTKQGPCFYPCDIARLFPQDRLLAEMGAESYWGAPLRNNVGVVIGILAILDDRPMEERPQTLALLSTFALRAAVELERRRAEQALRESEERFRTLIDAAPMSVLALRDGQYIFGNPESARLLGYAGPDAFVGMAAMDTIAPEYRQAIRERISRAVGGQRNEAMEMKLLRADGETRWAMSSSVPITFDGKPTTLIVGQDISERKRAEEERGQLQAQLAQAQKMESVGRLAGGVAHDFNNMLSVILGHAELALQEADPAQSLYADLREIRSAAQRSADLTRQLLAFARKQTIAPRVLDLNGAVAGTIGMLRRLIGEEIELVWSPSAGLWPVKMDPTQIDQILANLCVNARDAISGVGQVSLTTANLPSVAIDRIVHPDAAPGDHVLLAVTDTGCGMSQDVLDHLFEPFFTTKAVGQGTGLGLATVYGIVKQNGGWINVRSKVGQGTTFEVCLPRCAEAPASGLSARQTEAARGHGEVVLVVEDEDAILWMSRMMLQRQGYQVLAAGAPTEALRLAEEHAGEISLLITDVVMPEMNGRELAERIRAIKPGLRCLFMSGYTADVIAQHGALEAGMHLLEKPFSLETLAAKVRAALAGA